MKKNKLLIASLLVNAFFAGILFSHASFLRADHPRPPHMMEHKIKKVAKHLPKEYRAQIIKIIDKHDPKIRNKMDNMHSTLMEIDGVLTAEKFDEAKFLELTKKLDPKDKNIKANMSEMILSIAKTLPDEHRIKFFKKISKRKGKFRRFK